jgi:hypothetical protein
MTLPSASGATSKESTGISTSILSTTETTIGNNNDDNKTNNRTKVDDDMNGLVGVFAAVPIVMVIGAVAAILVHRNRRARRLSKFGEKTSEQGSLPFASKNPLFQGAKGFLPNPLYMNSAMVTDYNSQEITNDNLNNTAIL